MTDTLPCRRSKCRANALRRMAKMDLCRTFIWNNMPLHLRDSGLLSLETLFSVSPAGTCFQRVGKRKYKGRHSKSLDN